MTKQPSDVGSENYNRVMDGLEEIAEWTDEDFARAEIRKGGVVVRPERKRGELTLREKVAQSVAANPDVFSEDPIKRHQAASLMRVVVKQQEAFSVVDAISSILEDTGSPAHMRVAAELRGE